MNKEEQIAKAEESVITKPSDILQSDASINTEKTIQIAQYAEFFQGPLPHPNLLRQYNDIVPGFAQEVTKAMIEQSQHRREIEKLVIVSKIEQAKMRTVYCGFCHNIICRTQCLYGQDGPSHRSRSGCRHKFNRSYWCFYYQQRIAKKRTQRKSRSSPRA
jgi:uncharacterized membrane protein